MEKAAGGRVPVTGADGFIGSHVVERLVRDGAEVRAAMRGSAPVLYLAALISIPSSDVAPAVCGATNVNGALNLLQAARDLEVVRPVITSTSEVYGTARIVPIREARPYRCGRPMPLPVTEALERHIVNIPSTPTLAPAASPAA